MTNTYSQGGLRFFQSANEEAEIIRENFVVRLTEFELIMQDIRTNPMTGSIQHYLVLGRRGSGKSTLLKRLEVEINQDVELSKTFLAINLAEEQANIYKLFDLLEEILKELDQHDIVVETPSWNEDAHQYARQLFEAIHKAIEKSGRKIILLLDNIDRIFENLHDEASLLREYLLNYDDMRIIGGSTRMTEHFWKYNKPFYQFFRVLELQPLNSEEIKTMFLCWSARYQLPELADFVQNKPGQLETIRILTDGLPRTLQFFVQILLTKSEESGYDYLRMIMDRVTPLYQERLNNLPPAQRKIVLQLAFAWESAGAGTLAEATKMDTKVISAQLKQLTDKGIAEKIPTDTKNHLYRLSERFFNLWLIFTQGSPREKRRAKYLTIFLENFYNEQELLEMASQHLNALQTGSLSASKAAMLTKALVHSKYINVGLRDELISKTLVLPNIPEELKAQLPFSSDQILDKVSQFVNDGDVKKAIKYVQEIDANAEYTDFLMGILFFFSNEYEKAEPLLLQVANRGFAGIGLYLGKIYESQDKLEEALEYFRSAAEYGTADAQFSLGKLLHKIHIDDQAEKQFDQLIEKDRNYAIPVASYYLKLDIRKSKKYFKMGIVQHPAHAAFGIAVANWLLLENPEESWQMMQEAKDKEQALSPIFQVLDIMISTWSGHLKGVEEKVQNLISDDPYPHLDTVLIYLLAYKLYSLVQGVFLHPVYGASLQEKYKPIYYATEILLNSKQNIDLKIPPELEGTIDEIKKRVEAIKQKYTVE